MFVIDTAPALKLTFALSCSDPYTVDVGEGWRQMLKQRRPHVYQALVYRPATAIFTEWIKVLYNAV
jgi:hypothetical protein